MRALILDHAESRAALAGVRALAEAGWTVGVASQSGRPLSGASRHVGAVHAVPGPEHDLDGFVVAINDALAAGGYEVIFPTEDVHVMALSANRARIDAIVPYAEHAVVRRAFDKLELGGLCARAGLKTPRTVAATEEAVAAWRGPAIVKARFHGAVERPGAPARFWTRLAPSGEEAARRCGEMRAAGGEPLLQEVIDGHQMSFVAVSDRRGRIVASTQHETDRLYPPGNGITARARSVSVDPHLEASVATALAELGWFGLTELEFRLAPDGSAFAVDFNGRYYGSMALALDCGVNVADAWARLAVGRLPAPGTRARAGVGYQWIEGDLRAGLAEGAGPLRAVADSLSHAARSHHSIMRLDDPGPALRELARAARRGAGALRARIR